LNGAVIMTAPDEQTLNSESTMSEANDPNNRDANRDPITGEPGSHPVGTGVGAASGGATGAAIGTAVAGPIGTAVGAVIGAVAGGLAGKATAEAIDPTAEDAYWRDNHKSQTFAHQHRSYDDYQPAYRAGYEGFGRHAGTSSSGRFEDAETNVRSDYEKSSTSLPWEDARPAAHAAWTRLQQARSGGQSQSGSSSVTGQ
jgi:uncharacterized protein YcfJ